MTSEVRRVSNVIGTLILILFFSFSCFHRELRGKVYKSKNKSTYLVIQDDCNKNQLFVDGKLWPKQTNELGEITPGFHKITGCGEVSIEIKEGTIFKFDYWGP